jgi:hypothetical protein
LFYYEPEPSLKMLKQMQGIGEKELPLVWTHKSGRKSLVLGCTAQHVKDVDAMKSAEILVGLREWATSEQFSYSHEWSVGDLGQHRHDAPRRAIRPRLRPDDASNQAAGRRVVRITDCFGGG